MLDAARDVRRRCVQHLRCVRLPCRVGALRGRCEQLQLGRCGPRHRVPVIDELRGPLDATYERASLPSHARSRSSSTRSALEASIFGSSKSTRAIGSPRPLGRNEWAGFTSPWTTPCAAPGTQVKGRIYP